MVGPASPPDRGRASGDDPCGHIPRDVPHLAAMEACTAAQPLTADEAATVPTGGSEAVSQVETWGRTNAVDSYAGLARADGGYVLHYVPSGTTATELVSRASAVGITVVPANCTLADLQSVAEAISAASAPLTPFDIFPDITNNIVVVRSRTAAAAALAQFYSKWSAAKVLVKFDDTTTYAALRSRRTL